MADFNGDLTTGLSTQFGSTSVRGYTVPDLSVGFGSPGGPSGGPAAHYKLRAHRTSDDTWQYWVDTSVGLVNAPGGAINYDAASLTIEGIF